MKGPRDVQGFKYNKLKAVSTHMASLSSFVDSKKMNVYNRRRSICMRTDQQADRSPESICKPH